MPIFPLPETVFFPHVALPLHLFEPRYRQMGEDASKGDGLLVVVLLKPGWKVDYESTPPVHDIATLGRLVEHERLEDGRFRIVLRGVERVRILEPEASELAEGKLYRVRRIEPAREHSPEPSEATSALLRAVRSRWNELLQKSGRSEPESQRVPDDAPFEELVNHVATFVDIPPHEKQKLLDEDNLIIRAARLEGHLDEQLKFWRTLSRFREFSPDDPSVN